jgi:hypothetical protein
MQVDGSVGAMSLRGGGQGAEFFDESQKQIEI